MGRIQRFITFAFACIVSVSYLSETVCHATESNNEPWKKSFLYHKFRCMIGAEPSCEPIFPDPGWIKMQSMLQKYRNVFYVATDQRTYFLLSFDEQGIIVKIPHRRGNRIMKMDNNRIIEHIYEYDSIIHLFDNLEVCLDGYALGYKVKINNKRVKDWVSITMFNDIVDDGHPETLGDILYHIIKCVFYYEYCPELIQYIPFQ